MSSFNGVPVPSNGQKIEYSNGKYRVPDHPIIPFIEGDGTGRDIWKASVRVFDAAVEKAYQGKRSVAWYEVSPAKKLLAPLQELASGRYRHRHPRFPCSHQRAADHTRRRRHPLAERRPATDPRPLLLRPSCEVLRRRSLAREASRAHGYRDLPREHRRRLHGR